jgi:hypothetical protein
MWRSALRCEALEQCLKVVLEACGEGRRIKLPAGTVACRGTIGLRRIRARAVAETVAENEPADDAYPDRGQVLQVLPDMRRPGRVGVTAPSGRGRSEIPAVAEPRIVHPSIHGSLPRLDDGQHPPRDLPRSGQRRVRRRLDMLDVSMDLFLIVATHDLRKIRHRQVWVNGEP